MTAPRVAPEMWPKEPWARSMRQAASLRALEALGDGLLEGLSAGAVELFVHRGHVDDALRDGRLAFPMGATHRERATARALRTAEFGAIGLAIVSGLLAIPVGLVLLSLLGMYLWYVHRLRVPGSPMPAGKMGWAYASERTDIHLAWIGISYVLLLWFGLAPVPGRPMREIGYGCVMSSTALLLALARFRHADRIAQRVARNGRDGLRRLIEMDAVVLRWDPPARQREP
jgi:hypothetical protein